MQSHSIDRLESVRPVHTKPMSMAVSLLTLIHDIDYQQHGSQHSVNAYLPLGNACPYNVQNN